MKNHMTWMLIGCLGIFLLLFLLPVIGFNGSNSLFIFLILFFGAHLFMMGSLGGHSAQSTIQNNNSKNKEDHATHKH